MVRRTRETPPEQEWIFRDYVPPEIEERPEPVSRGPRHVFTPRRASDRVFRIQVHPMTKYRQLHSEKRNQEALDEYIAYLQHKPLRNMFDATIVVEEAGYVFGYYERRADGWAFVSQRDENHG